MLGAAFGFLTPDPLSPLFKEGGRFYGWNEDVTLVIISLLALAVLDYGFVKRFLHPGGRYFALHAAANAATAVAAWPDVYRAIRDPTAAFGGPSTTMVANSVVCGIHLYHVLAFRLKAADIFHHLTFTAILCGLAIPFKQVGGVANNFGCFFLSGVPGGIDYVLLVLVKQGYMGKLTEKKWNSTINTWLRGPAMSIYACLAYVCWSSGKLTPTGLDRFWYHDMCLIVAAGLHFYNGQHYAQEAVGGYYKWAERERLEKSQ